MFMFDDSRNLANGDKPDSEVFPTASKSDSVLSRRAPADPYLPSSYLPRGGRKMKYLYSRKLEDTSHQHPKLKETESSNSLSNQTSGGKVNEGSSKPKIIDAMKSKSDVLASHKSVRYSIIRCVL